MVWLGFFEKNVFLRTSGVRAKPSKRISTFSVAKGLIVFGRSLNSLVYFVIPMARWSLFPTPITSGVSHLLGIFVIT